MDLVSAIITTHNRYDLLKKAIDSVLCQTYPNIECIVVDDASDKDNTLDIREKYGERVKFIRIEKKDSKGGNHARNVGIQNSKGKYVAFLDDDDIWSKEKIEKQIEYLNNNPQCEFVYCGRTCDYIEYEEECLPDELNQGDCSNRILYNIICVTSTIMCTKRILELVGGFDENLKFWQEYDLTIRIFQHTKVGYVNEPLIRYLVDQNDKNRLTNKYYEWWNSVKYQNNKYKDLINSLTEDEKKKRKQMIYHDAVLRSGNIGDKKEIRKNLWMLCRLDFSVKNLKKFIFFITPEWVKKIRNLLKGNRK